MTVTHEDLRRGRLNIYQLTGDEAADLVSKYDAVCAERDQLREIIRDQVPYPASPDSEPANPSETPNGSTQTTTPID